MPELALVLLALYGALAIGLRVAIQLVRTGSTGLRGLGPQPGAAEVAAAALLVAGVALAVAAALTGEDGAGTIDALDGRIGHAAGIGLCLGGMLATVASQLAMGDAWRVGVDPEERTELVTSGPFSVVRNPIYSGMIPFFLGIALLVPSALSLAGAALVLLGLELQTRRVEEPHLLRAHGQEDGLLPVFSKLWVSAVALSVAHAEGVSGQQATPENVEPLTWELRSDALQLGAMDYLAAIVQLQAHTRQVVALWDEYDVVLTPALAKRPVKIGEIDACGENPRHEFWKSGQFTPYTALFNVTGQPAISVPLFHGDDGLPLAVQLAGPPAGEALLLSLAAQLEQARPWADRRPELSPA